jgi:hypothetical protein
LLVISGSSPSLLPSTVCLLGSMQSWPPRSCRSPVAVVEVGRRDRGESTQKDLGREGRPGTRWPGTGAGLLVAAKRDRFAHDVIPAAHPGHLVERDSAKLPPAVSRRGGAYAG